MYQMTGNLTLIQSSEADKENKGEIMNKTLFKVLGISLAVILAAFLAACPEEQDKNKDNNIDSSLYGTWRNDHRTLVITFSYNSITWGGTVGDAFNDLSGYWTAKNGTISHNIYDSGITTKAYDYNIDSSGKLILTYISGAKYTLTKDDGSSGGAEPVLGSGTDGDFEYDYGATTVTITGYTGIGEAVTIPSTIDGKPVTAIKDGTYNNGVFTGVFYNKQLTSVTIPNSVTTIGNYAFRNNQLTSVTIGNSVTIIGSGAFASNQLTSVTIPNSVTYLSGFNGNQLTSVIIPNSVTYLSGFSGNQLTSVTIPDSVTTIGEDAFSRNQLTSVTIGNSVTIIWGSAFSTNQLTSVTIPNSVIAIGTFIYNPLTSVTIGANVELTGGVESFPGNFDTVYKNGGKLAGIYTGVLAQNDDPYYMHTSWSKN